MQKSKWLTYLLIASPVGIVSGYSMSAVFLENIGWRFAFYIKAALMIPSLICMLMIPAKYMDIKKTGMLIRLHQKRKEYFK